MDWININDKYPEPYQEVIICSTEGRVKSAIYVGNKKWNTFLDVEFWQPFPKPPNVDKKEDAEEPVKKKRGRPKKA